MIYRLYANKDTTIVNTVKLGTKQTGSNLGGSEILELYKISGVSGSSGVYSSSSLSRILLKFDVSEFSQLTASSLAPTTGSLFYLRLKNARHSETQPSSFDVEVSPLTRDWDEGKGIDYEGFTDKGFANWDKSKSNVFWTTPGGDFLTTITASFHFDQGDEDLEVNVTPIVNAWLTGGLANHGLLVRLTGSVERDSLYEDYYVKRFHGRSTHVSDTKPTLEARWFDYIRTGSYDDTQLTGSAQYVANVLNLKNDYETFEYVRFNVFFRKRDYNPSVVATASLAPNGLVIPNVYYRIENEATREHVIPFGTGSSPTTLLSYASGSNYFDLWMNALQAGNTYRIVFLLDIQNRRQIIDRGFKFRVV